MLNALIQTIRDFLDDDCPTNAAAIAYYAIFSLPAVLFLILVIIGAVIDPHTVQQRIIAQFGDLLGTEAAHQIETIVVLVRSRTSGGGTHVVLGVLALLFGASGAFLQLQSALNRAWEVKKQRKDGRVRTFLLKRIVSFGMLLTIAFLLLVSLVVSALLSSLGDYIGALLGGLSGALLSGLQFVFSVVVIALLFSIMFKVLPDTRVAWNDVWIGGAVSALLFAIGKFAIGAYLGHSRPGSAFGAAGALVILMIWIYYSAMIVLFGAELTQAVSRAKGRALGGAVQAV
jgi:membrane protein